MTQILFVCGSPCDNVTTKAKLELCFILPRAIFHIYNGELSDNIHYNRSVLFRIIASTTIDKAEGFHVERKRDNGVDCDN